MAARTLTDLSQLKWSYFHLKTKLVLRKIIHLLFNHFFYILLFPSSAFHPLIHSQLLIWSLRHRPKQVVPLFRFEWQYIRVRKGQQQTMLTNPDESKKKVPSGDTKNRDTPICRYEPTFIELSPSITVPLSFAERPSLTGWPTMHSLHYNDVMMGAMASQITSITIVYSTVYSGAD